MQLDPQLRVVDQVASSDDRDADEALVADNFIRRRGMRSIKQLELDLVIVAQNLH